MKVVRVIVLLGLACALVGAAFAGTHARIDTRLANETIHVLVKGSPAQKQAQLEIIKAHPEMYAPPVFYVLSHALFQDGYKDEGAFWFYAGQLRARYDANRSADPSAKQAIAVLNQSYGFLINQYAHQDLPKLERLIAAVVEWDRQTPYRYDHRWITLHGLHAVLAGLGGKGAATPPEAPSLPEDQWPAIAERTRVEYLNTFAQMTARMKGER